MKVIEYLNHPGNTIELLKDTYGIKVSQNDTYPNLYVLNYCQIESPKTHPIIRECRSLVIEKSSNDKTYKVVSRSFDRFFNLGEELDVDHDITSMVAHEKVDGSLVTLFHYQGEWLYRTRSMIMPEESLKINGGLLSWKELIESTTDGLLGTLVPDLSYIMEIVSPENRIVTRYPTRSIYLLAVRNNKTGEFQKISYPDESGILIPRQYQFDTIQHCIDASKSLPNLEEGYVLYDKDTGAPVVKVKSPAYVAAHRLRGETILTPKRMIDLLLLNEQDEYLSIFPEDKDAFKPYQDAFINMFETIDLMWQSVKHIEDQKSFALKVKEFPYSGILFKTRACREFQSTRELFDMMSDKSKYRLVEYFVVPTEMK